MIPRRACILVLLTVLAGSPGRTQDFPLDVDLQQNVLAAPPGSTALVSGRLFNPGDEILHLTGIACLADTEFVAGDAFDLFSSHRPDTLAPGEAWEGPFVRLTVSPQATQDARVFTLFFTGGGNAHDHRGLAQVSFLVNDTLLVTGVREDEPLATALAASPNPTRGATSIRFALRAPSRIVVEVVDVAGRRVTGLRDAVFDPGVHHVEWDGRTGNGTHAPSGVYFIRVRTPRSALATKVILIP